MSQLIQALEVLKNISQVKARLMNYRIELGSIMERSIGSVIVESNKTDGSINEVNWHELRDITDAIDTLVKAIEVTDLWR